MGLTILFLIRHFDRWKSKISGIGSKVQERDVRVRVGIVVALRRSIIIVYKVIGAGEHGDMAKMMPVSVLKVSI